MEMKVACLREFIGINAMQALYRAQDVKHRLGWTKYRP